MTDYLAMTPGAMMAALGDDAERWADAFLQHVARNPSIATDRAVMIGWFAGAIEAATDRRRARAVYRSAAAIQADVVATVAKAWETDTLGEPATAVLIGRLRRELREAQAREQRDRL